MSHSFCPSPRSTQLPDAELAAADVAHDGVRELLVRRDPGGVELRKREVVGRDLRRRRAVHAQVGRADVPLREGLRRGGNRARGARLVLRDVEVPAARRRDLVRRVPVAIQRELERALPAAGRRPGIGQRALARHAFGDGLVADLALGVELEELQMALPEGALCGGHEVAGEEVVAVRRAAGGHRGRGEGLRLGHDVVDGRGHRLRQLFGVVAEEELAVPRRRRPLQQVVCRGRWS